MSLLLLVGAPSGSGPSPAPTPAEWRLDITDRANTTWNIFRSTDSADTFPVLAFDGQDTQNDIGLAHLTVPAEHSFNDYLTEDNIAHLYVREQYVTSYIIGVPKVTIVDRDEEAGAVATYELKQLVAVLEEGVVLPATGFESLPTDSERRFDFSDLARDNSDFSSANVLCTVSDAQSVYAVTPYGQGIEYPDQTSVIGAPGYGLTDHSPDGDQWGYEDATFTAGTYRVNAVGDNVLVEFLLDGHQLIGRTIGFGNSTQTSKFTITAGGHRIAWRVWNGGGTAGLNGPCTVAWEFVEVDAADNAIGLGPKSGTNSKWKTGSVPGINAGKILLITLDDMRLRGYMSDVGTSFDEDNDSDGNAWDTPVEQSAKTSAPLEDFWLKDMTSTLCDIDCTWAGAPVLHAWKKGSHKPAASMALAQGTNLGSLEVPQAAHKASGEAVTWNYGGDQILSLIDEAAESGHPPKMRPLSLGAARQREQMNRDAAAELDKFNRVRQKPTATFLYNANTANGDMPPFWWKWSQIGLTVSSRWLSSGTLECIAVSWKLDDNGNLEFTPEFGDLLLDGGMRVSQTVRRMVTGVVHDARVNTRLDRFAG